MKGSCKRFVCFFCSLILFAINITVFSAKTIEDAPVDSPNEGLAAEFGSVLNEYIKTFGVISDEHPAGFITGSGSAPNGLVYADIVNFDNNDYPYLILFLSDAENDCASCHIWCYDRELDRARRIAELRKPYQALTRTRGAFAIGWNGDKRYITYKEFDAETTYENQCFTVINNEAFQYVEDPGAVNEAAVINFTSDTFCSDVDISYYNKALSVFFDRLKDTAAAYVSYDDISPSISSGDMSALETEVSIAAQIGNFDILDYETMAEYENALAEKRSGALLYSISNVHSLGDEMYYVRFATDLSFYNYALMRRTDRSEKYQILKVRLDCIPLSDRELDTLKTNHIKSNLLYKKATDGYAAPTREPQQSLIKIPKIFVIPKLFDKALRKPAAYASAALTVLLITGLWVLMYDSPQEP